MNDECKKCLPYDVKPNAKRGFGDQGLSMKIGKNGEWEYVESSAFDMKDKEKVFSNLCKFY